MAWTRTSPVIPVGVTHIVPAVSVPATQAAWWADYAADMHQEFLRRVRQYSLNVANVQVTVVALDSQGIGQLTLTFVTS